tara:strand:+ start:174 stop:1064 length:891 start_codon:yes stop_codon:yes gene_type:complete
MKRTKVVFFNIKKKYSPYSFVLSMSIAVFLLVLTANYISLNNFAKNDINPYVNSTIVSNTENARNLNYKSVNLEKKKLKKVSNLTIKEKKLQFISAFLPIIQEINLDVLEKRRKIFLVEKKLKANNLNVLDADFLKRTFKEYKVKNNDINVLKERVDIVPISLTLAQAAIESGWGTSRFAKEGNAFFGQKVVGSSVNGIDPAENKNPLIKVRKFNNLSDSVEAYIKNLNTHRAYKKFRKSRKAQRSIKKHLDGIALAETLGSYSELGDEYTAEVQKIIKINSLDKFDYLEYKTAKN